MPSPNAVPASDDLQLALGRVREAVGQIERGPELGNPDQLGRELLAATQGLSDALIDLMIVPGTTGEDRKGPRRYDAADG